MVDPDITVDAHFDWAGDHFRYGIAKDGPNIIRVRGTETYHLSNEITIQINAMGEIKINRYCAALERDQEYSL